MDDLIIKKLQVGDNHEEGKKIPKKYKTGMMILLHSFFLILELEIILQAKQSMCYQSHIRDLDQWFGVWKPWEPTKDGPSVPSANTDELVPKSPGQVVCILQSPPNSVQCVLCIQAHPRRQYLKSNSCSLHQALSHGPVYTSPEKGTPFLFFKVVWPKKCLFLIWTKVYIQ